MLEIKLSYLILLCASSEYLLQTTEEFITEFSIYSPDSSNTSELAKLSYDSIWTMALTFNKTMDSWRTSGQYERRLGDFRYKTGTDMKNDFMDILGRLEFTGVSVRFI